ncbi:MAG: hypothetical protein ACOX52_19675 [Verrucomicrobiota bacterium]
MRARSQPGQESIPIPIPTPTPIQTMIGLIGNPSYPYTYPYTYTYCSPHHRVRVRVPLRCVRVRFWAELEAVRKGLRIRMGRTPAEIAEGAEGYWEGGRSCIVAVFNNCLGQLNRCH